MDFKELLKSADYDFLRNNERLKKHVILLGLGGSHAYGTNIENSDVDIRGIMLNTKEDLIGLSSYEQFEDKVTDTVIYTFNKMIPLLMACNPNTIEILGLRKEQYLYLHPLGEELLSHAHMFLSRRAIKSFGGYADAQLRRLENALARDNYTQSEKEVHILNSVRSAMYDFNEVYNDFQGGRLNLFIDQAVNPELDTEIFVDADLKHYPLRDYESMWNVMHNVVKAYDKVGKRNKKKDELHLNKHAMHLIRLFMMGIDILEKEEIKTYREEEHDLLMDIRMGKYQGVNGNFNEAFYDMLNEYEKRMEYAAKNTSLPEVPDQKLINEYVMHVNECVILGDY